MRVALFVTCLVDQFFPHVGVATVRLLRHLGVEVDFPPGQTCCGQLAFNAGFPAEARALARRMVKIFASAEAVVAPSGSCVAMVRQHFPELLQGNADWHRRAQELASKTYEFSEFLVQRLGREELGARLSARVTYHDSCQAQRGLYLAEEPRRLLRAVDGLTLVELADRELCCGFGGTFAVDFAEVSGVLGAEKVNAIEGTGADYVVSTDCSCLLHLAGILRRRGSRVRPLHLAELLAQGVNHAA